MFIESHYLILMDALIVLVYYSMDFSLDVGFFVSIVDLFMFGFCVSQHKSTFLCTSVYTHIVKYVNLIVHEN